MRRRCDRCHGLSARAGRGSSPASRDRRRLPRLDGYLVAKDRLHNRYLTARASCAGWRWCATPATTRSTCGRVRARPVREDVVVCTDTRVDVAGLMRGSDGPARVDCAPFRTCRRLRGRRAKWILGICYEERPARAVKPTRAPTAACAGACGGSCGASAALGRVRQSCGAPGQRHRHRDGSMSTSAVGTPAGCENTVTCEGFRFVLSPDTPASRRPRTPTDGSPHRQGRRPA